MQQNQATSTARSLVEWIGAGAAAAVLLLVNDAIQIRLTFGVWSLPRAPLVLLTLAGGILGSLLVAGLWLSIRRFVGGTTRPTAVQTFAFTFALLYGVAAGLRFDRIGFLRRMGDWAPPLATLIVWAGVVFVLQRIGAATGRGWLGVLCAGLFLAFFVVGNRELVGRPTSPEALAFDAAGFVVAVVVLLLLRSRRSRDTPPDRASLVGLATLLFLVATLVATQVSRRQGNAARLAEATAAGPPADAPHLVLLVFDTMRGDVFEDVLENTEEGRAFAEAVGPITWFHQATAAAPWTGPTMSTVLTGVHPLQHQVKSGWASRLAKDQLTLGEHLHGAGYQTLAVVANRALERSVGVDRGFQVYEGLPTSRDLTALGPLQRRFRDRERPASRPESWFLDARQARKVLQDRLHLVDPGHPVFLWYHLMDTHAPLKDHSDLAPTPGDAGLTARQLLYRNNARFALAETALALGAIEERLDPENTLFIVLADHGEMLPADNQFAPGHPPDKPRNKGHGHAYHDTVIRIPLGIRLPPSKIGNPPRGHSDRLVSQLDVVPTVVDVLEQPWPEDLQGCSLVALSTAPPGPEPEHCHPFVVSDGNGGRSPHGALRTPRLKLMASPTDAFAPLLFDLQVDPYEQEDRSAQEPDAAASALALLRRYWEEYTSDRPAAAGELAPRQIETLRALGYL